MKVHHTKTKGDLGVAKAYYDLVEKGYLVLFPSTEHAPFDLVAYENKTFVRIQVKYRSAVNNSIHIKLESWWADKNGSHGKPIDKSEIDVYCVYCPDTNKCYYFKPMDVNSNFTLRLNTPKNNQLKKVHFAEDFTEVP
jgi:PD-(D/E)XK endonuclease